MICLTSLLDLPHGCALKPKGPDRLMLASPLPSELFVNPRCPSVPTAIKAMTAEVQHSEGLHMGKQLRHCFGHVL